MNPKFSLSRTTRGLAFETGLPIDEMLGYLRQMEKNGDAQPYPGDSTKGEWWALTRVGREKFASLRNQPAEVPMEDTEIQ